MDNHKITRMKIIYTLFITALISSMALSQRDLITKKKFDLKNSESVEIIIEGYSGYEEFQSIDGSGHYFGQCIAVSFENNVDTAFNINIPAGAILICDDSTVQNMIITKSFEIFLYPKEMSSYKIYAMCGEINDQSPRKGVYYNYGGLADSNIVAIAKVIEENNSQDYFGQHAMWATANNVNFKKLMIYGADSTSILKTLDLLEKAQVINKLTEEFKGLSHKDEPKVIHQKNNLETVHHIESWIFWSALSGFIVVTFILIVIIVRLKKNTEVI
jgi:hypothetical protein